jgi:hypothetical protein
LSSQPISFSRLPGIRGHDGNSDNVENYDRSVFSSESYPPMTETIKRSHWKFIIGITAIAHRILFIGYRILWVSCGD